MLGVNEKPKAIIAAAKRVTLDKLQRLGEPWQDNLWDIYEALGPVHYGAQFKRNAAQKVSFFVAEEADEESDEPIPTDNEQALEAFDRLGDVPELVGELVVHANIVGEGYLVGFDDVEPTDPEFEIWSAQELKARKNDREAAQPDYSLRIWRPNPRKHALPDSPLRSVQQQCEALLLLNDEMTATSMSRVPAGFLLVPDELSFGTNAEDYPDTGQNADGDPFMAEVIEIVMAAIRDPDAAARVAPNVIRGPAEYLKEFRYIDIARKMDEVFAGMREDLIRQIAAGLDLPPEIILGKADLNHWTAWDVDDSAAKLHVDPDVLFAIDGMTRGYLWPALMEAGMGVDDAKRFQIWRDFSDLTSRPLTIDQAERFFDKGVIDAVDLRQIANLAQQEPNEVTSADIAKLGEAVGVYFRAGFEPEAILEALGLPPIAHTGAAPVTVKAESEIDETPEGPRTEENTDQLPPQVPGVTAAAAVDIRPLAEIDRSLATRITEATEAAFQRAMERAGVRVRNKARKDRQLTALITDLADERVTRTLGVKRIEQLQMTMDQLLPRSEFEPLRARLLKLIENGQHETAEYLSELFGVEIPVSPEQEEDRISAVDAFIAALFVIAGARLFTASPAPDPAETGEFNDDIASTTMVVDLLTEAGGGTPERGVPRGLALGQRTRAAFRDHGYRVEARTWEWGFWRKPQNRYEPHFDLNGAEALTLEDPRLGGYWPGDHRGCTCELVPTILPEET